MVLYVKKAFLNSIGETPNDSTPIIVDRQPGATMDEKFTNALSLWGQSTIPRRVQFENGEHTLNQKGRLWAPGLQWGGPLGQHPGEAAKSDLDFRPCTITVNYDSSDGVGLFHGVSNNDVRGVGCSNIAVRASGDEALFTSASESVNSWVPHFFDITTSGLKHVFGTASVRWITTGGQFDGYWNVNNGTHWACRFTGSDTNFFVDGGLFDSPLSLHPGGAVGILDFDWSEKGTLGPVFVTCEGNWFVEFNGPDYNSGNTGNNGGPIAVSEGARFEGRNKNSPCTNPTGVIHQVGGAFKFENLWMAYCTAPNGLHQIEDGYALHNGVTYGRATGNAETYPMVRAMGTSVVDLAHASVDSKAGAWTNPRPAVADLTVAPGFVVKDGTYR